MKKSILICTALFALVIPAFSQNKKVDLSVTANDIYILPGDENGPDKNGSGYHLYIRKKSGMECVMLIDSNKDPEGKQTNYAYRATEYNKINGDEIRYLNGKELKSETAKYSLIDSTAEEDSKFGESFHIYIPEIIVYGYPWTRNASINIADGLFLNIRSFSKKYADYSGSFMDNSFVLSKRKTPVSGVKEKNEKTSVKTEEKSSVVEKKESVKPAHKETKKSVSDLSEKLAENDTSAGNFAEKYEAYNSSYVTNDETDLDVMSSVPFEEEELPASMFSDEDDDEESELTEGLEEEQDEEDSEAAEPVVPYDPEKPSVVPFVEEELPVEEEPAPEPEVEEIPEDERDVLSEVPYDEDGTEYDPAQLEKDRIVLEIKDDPVKPFNESMEGVDPDFVARLELEEALKNQKNEAAEETEESNKIDLGDRFITHGIDMIKVAGSKTIPDLYISKTEVTQGSYRSVTGTNPSTNQEEYHPVETVSWYDVIVFCNLLSIRDGLVPCYSINEARNPGAWGDVPKDGKKPWKVECDFDANGYRMLTIEEWEYAAAGGPDKKSGKYAGSNYIEDVAWYKDNSEETTHFVGMKMPNSCGLLDMCGNVSEWCWGDTGNLERTAAVRGGNYTYDKKYCKTNFKDSCQAWYAHYENGIRICRSVE